MTLEEEVRWLRLRLSALEAKASEADRHFRKVSWAMVLLTAVACADFIRAFVG
ncbi:hypothetical protein [Methylobacterium sp. J-070]|uniref:hypothetical protein n=1 Tax=Methylobacterium sp. J-070 TaxID=2836650 RepID=UPI001FBA91C2|nr:hypothetical protein [Methylobacterium sp. J-070]MCJ2051694.1 hypothetical protein [Methylobacterium sp. J-070]